MRLLHTADWHLGLAFPGHGAASDALREARYRTVERIADLARERAVDLVLVAGDAFDGPAVASARLLFVIGVLARIGRPVVLLPGNHDPHVAGGVWERAEWRHAPATIVRALDATPLVFDELGVVVRPCPLGDKGSPVDPTLAIDRRRFPDRIEVALAHGSLPVGDARVSRPIDLSRPALAALDYVALGDWHAQRLVHRADGRLHAAYPGTPEPTGVGERSSGAVLLVDLDGPGAPVRAESVPVATYDWVAHRAEVGSVADVERLLRDLAAISAPARTVLELALAGRADLDALALLDDLGAALARFAAHRVARSELALAVDPAEIARRAPPGPLGAALASIAAHLVAGDPTRAVAEAALRRYHELTH